jgi:hypothetical protein
MILFDECTSVIMITISPPLLILNISYDGTFVSHYNYMN